jgi:hypothetical protein
MNVTRLHPLIELQRVGDARTEMQGGKTRKIFKEKE